MTIRSQDSIQWVSEQSNWKTGKSAGDHNDGDDDYDDNDYDYNDGDDADDDRNDDYDYDYNDNNADYDEKKSRPFWKSGKAHTKLNNWYNWCA